MLWVLKRTISMRYSKPVLSGHSKIDKKKVLMTNGSIVKVKRVAECSKGEHSAIHLTCIKQELVLKTNMWSFLE